MSSTLAKIFVYERCVKTIKSTIKAIKKLPFYDNVELVKSFVSALPVGKYAHYARKNFVTSVPVF